MDYQIQYGDTLSEIAAANNTTVANLMELNPHIENPNMIFAGDHLVIPTNDYATNPYEGWNPQWNQSADIYLADGSSDYGIIDWGSFEDQPLDDYSGFLQTENFQEYSNFESYLDFSNDLSSFDFF
jgi:LysM repeat protein